MDYLLKNGSPRFKGEIQAEIYQIRMMAKFSYKENGEEKGIIGNIN